MVYNFPDAFHVGGGGGFSDFNGFEGFGASMIGASASGHAGNQVAYGSVPVAGKRHPTNPNLVADGNGNWIPADLAYSLGPKGPPIQTQAPTITLPPITITAPNFNNYPTVNISMADVLRWTPMIGQRIG